MTSGYRPVDAVIGGPLLSLQEATVVSSCNLRRRPPTPGS